MKEDILSSLDNYGRVARLYPALLALAPAIWTLTALTPSSLSNKSVQLLGSAGLLLGAYTLLVNVARSRGKAFETKLLSTSGGWRTTALLRHSDGTFDSFTKARYHSQLQTLCRDVSLPTPAEETLNPQDADSRYRSVTLRLIELRREPKFKMLHRENAQYGFRRNLLGLKRIALIVVALALVYASALLLHGLPQGSTYADKLFADAEARPTLYVVLVADVIDVLVWLILVRPGFVIQSATEYAIALFRTLEGPEMAGVD